MKPDSTLSSGHIAVLSPNTDVKNVISTVVHKQKQEDAFFICDVGDLVNKYKNWQRNFPRVTPFYAVKCNASRTVLQVLAALGTGFDCASKGEIEKVRSIGVSVDRIIYANPVKQASHLRYAASCHVDLMTFDNEQELFKTKKLYPNARLVLRIRCDAAKAQCFLGMKFGIEPHLAPSLLATAQQLGLNVVGVSFHVGSGCEDVAIFGKAIKAAKQIFEKAKSFGFEMNLLDIGGGYPGEMGSSISEFANVINAALDTHFPVGCGVEVIAEPGRYFVASAFTLAAAIVGRREVLRGGDRTFMYYINDGAYGSFNCLLYDHAVVHPNTLLGNEQECEYVSSVWGPTCDGLDQVNTDVRLPLLEVGDWLLYENMGAYTLVAASGFNGFPIPSIFNVISDAARDYLSREVGMPASSFVAADRDGFRVYPSIPASSKSAATVVISKKSTANFITPFLFQESCVSDMSVMFSESFLTPPASS